MIKVHFCSDFRRVKPVDIRIGGVRGIPKSVLLSGEVVNFRGLPSDYRLFLSQNNGEGAIYYKSKLLIEFIGTNNIIFKGQTIQIKPEHLGLNPDRILVNENLEKIKIKGKPDASKLFIYLNDSLVAYLQLDCENLFRWLSRCWEKRKCVERDRFEGFEYDETKIDLDLVLAIYFSESISRIPFF